MNRIASRRPDASQWTADYHTGLIGALSGDDVLTILDDQLFWLCELAGHLPPMVIDVVHKPYQWTIRQVFAHGIEAERVFAFRMQHIAAADSTELPSFDHDAYVDQKYGLGNFSNLVTEWGYTRMATLLFLRRIAPRCWDQTGVIDGQTLTLRALAWITAGHFQHHLNIVEQRVGQTVQRQPPSISTAIAANH